MHPKITYRSKCRLCGSPEVKEFIRFPSMPFTDDFVTPERKGTEFRADLPIYWCRTCSAAQTLHDVDVSGYYRDYRYTVSTSSFANQFMSRLAQRIVNVYDLRSGDRVIEIGSGDGCQLKAFQNLGCKVLGFEPSSELTHAAQAIGVPTVQTLFAAETIDRVPSYMLPAQVLLLTYTFDHLPDPAELLRLAHRVLDPDRGLLVLEIHDLDKIVERREISLLEHEHTIYLNKETLEQLLNRCNYRLLTTELMPDSERRGNSLLAVASPNASIVVSSASSTSPSELWARLSTFHADVRSGIDRFNKHVNDAISSGVRLAGYGAGGRGVMSLAMTGLSHPAIRYLCDVNTSFHGLLTPCSHVPVTPPEHTNVEPVDEVIVFSYAYMSEIRSRLSGFLERGGRLRSILELL